MRELKVWMLSSGRLPLLLGAEPVALAVFLPAPSVARALSPILLGGAPCPPQAVALGSPPETELGQYQAPDWMAFGIYVGARLRRGKMLWIAIIYTAHIRATVASSSSAGAAIFLLWQGYFPWLYSTIFASSPSPPLLPQEGLAAKRSGWQQGMAQGRDAGLGLSRGRCMSVLGTGGVKRIHCRRRRILGCSLGL